MAADSAGNDILAVGVPIGGFIGIGPFGTTLPAADEGNDPDLTLNAAIKKIGLVKPDGGPQFAWGSSGDPLTFWQDGYSIGSGDSTTTLTVSAAQALSDYTRQIISGAAPDTNKYTEVDGGGNDTVFVGFTEEVFKNGAIRRRAIGSMQLQSQTEDQSTRGQVLGVQLVFKINRSPLFNNKHFGEWVIPAS